MKIWRDEPGGLQAMSPLGRAATWAMAGLIAGLVALPLAGIRLVDRLVGRR